MEGVELQVAIEQQVRARANAGGVKINPDDKLTISLGFEKSEGQGLEYWHTLQLLAKCQVQVG